MSTTSYRVAELNGEKLDQAYPLVQLYHRRVTLEEWRAFALSSVTPAAVARSLQAESGPADRGLLVVEEPEGTILGLARYKIEAALAVGRRLEADEILCFGRFPEDWSTVLNLLILGLEGRAREAGCATVNLWFSADPKRSPCERALTRPRQRGHRLARWCYGKSLRPRPGPEQPAAVGSSGTAG